MMDILWTPIGFILAAGLVATLGVVYAALVISARTDAIINRCGPDDEFSFAKPSHPDSGKVDRGAVRPPHRAGHAAV
ncbi:MAG: hypothetical protein Q7T82_14795 [Armatimonadota bacterium]|nr:hypothetical protein [Armatimonadota bacterium]